MGSEGVLRVCPWVWEQPGSGLRIPVLTLIALSRTYTTLIQHFRPIGERGREGAPLLHPPLPQTPVLCLYSSSQISLVYDSSRFIWPLIRQETAAREPASLILSHPHPRTALIFIYNCINDAIPVVLMVCLLRGKKTLAYIFGEETRLLYEICHVCHVRL